MIVTHGTRVTIKWSAFAVGSSFFVPGVHQEDLARQLRAETNRMNLKVLIRKVVENNILGVRVWRLP